MTQVLFLAPSCSLYGGVARWLVDMNLALSARGVRCVTALADGASFHDSAKFRSAYPQLEYLVLDGRTGSPAGRREAAAKALRAARCDVVVPVMLADALEAAVQEKARGGFRIVYPVHEVNPGVTRDLRRYAPWLDAAVFADRRSHDHHVAHCEQIRPRASVIPCGVPEPSAPGAPRAPAGDGVLRIGYCGRLEHAAKRVLDLVALCRALAQAGVRFELLVAGEGSAEPELRRALAALHPQPPVVFLGPLRRELLYRDFYPRVDQVIICSDAETGPLVAFEAMIHGCLVVTSDFAGRSDNRLLMHDETCLVFPVGDMRSAAACVRRAMAAPDLVRAITGRSRSVAAAERSLEASAQRWQALIESLVPAPPVMPAGRLRTPRAARGGGLLDRLGLPDAASETLRRMLGRRFVHSSAGQEWPAYFAGS